MSQSFNEIETISPFKQQLMKRSNTTLGIGHADNMKRTISGESMLDSPRSDASSPGKPTEGDKKSPWGVRLKSVPSFEIPPSAGYGMPRTDSADSDVFESNDNIGVAASKKIFGAIQTPLVIAPPPGPSRRKSKVFDGIPNEEEQPQQFDIVRAFQDKRLNEVANSYNEKFNDVVTLNEKLRTEVETLQAKLKEHETARKFAEDAATKNYLMMKAELDKNESLTATNMQLIKDLAVERDVVEKTTKEKNKIEVESKNHEEALANSFSSEYKRLNQAFEMMKSRYESKKILLAQKCEEVEKLLSQNFELSKTIEILQKITVKSLPQALSAPSTAPKPKIRPMESPRKRVDHSDSDASDDGMLSFHNKDKFFDTSHANMDNINSASSVNSHFDDNEKNKAEFEKLSMSISELQDTLRNRDETIQYLVSGK
jgi:hypothetical protein